MTTTPATRGVTHPTSPASATGARRPVVPDPRWPVRLGLALAVVAVAAGIPTAVDGGILTGPAAMNGSARGTALVVVLVAVPLLLLSMRATVRGSARAVAGWLGALAYLLYNSVAFLFVTPFNRLFLVYVALLGLAVWALGSLLVRVDVGAFAARVSARLPARAIASYVWVVVVLNTAAWLSVEVPAVIRGDAAHLEGTGLPTNGFHVQDLALWLPLAAVAALWLWRRRPWGVLVVGGMLAFWVVESVGIAVDQWLGSLADPASPVVSMTLVPAFLVLAAVGCVPLVALLRRVE
jgi:hypothetical protein